MKLRNKKTGEIGYLHEYYVLVEQDESDLDPDERWFNSLAELNEEWEDYEEPKEYWFINNYGRIEKEKGLDDAWFVIKLKQIGNYFETREEAEKTVEKLKAWKRLKDKGFEFKDWCLTEARFEIKNKDEHIYKDLAIIFGGEE